MYFGRLIPSLKVARQIIATGRVYHVCLENLTDCGVGDNAQGR